MMTAHTRKIIDNYTISTRINLITTAYPRSGSVTFEIFGQSQSITLTRQEAAALRDAIIHALDHDEEGETVQT